MCYFQSALSCRFIGCLQSCEKFAIYSLLCVDRLLLKSARKLAQQYYLTYQEHIPTAQIVQRVANVMQEYTQSGYDKAFYCINGR